jgi:hypothetical protein
MTRMRMINQCQEVKSAIEDITALRDILDRNNKLKKLLIKMDGFIQEMLVQFYLMDALRLLIERRTYSSYHKVNILSLISLKTSFLKDITYSRYSYMVIVYKTM